MKRLLIMYARYGSGHKSIAEYVAKYIENHNDKYSVKLLDITNYGSALGNFSVKVMDFVSKHRTEFIFDFCYELMDHKISTLVNPTFAKKCYDNKKLRKIIQDYKPDVTISTHFYCSNLIAYYNKIGITSSKLLTIITDYRAHEFWTKNHQSINGFIVGNEIVKEELIKRGIPEKKIYPYGLPLNISIIENLDPIEVIYNRYNLKKGSKVYLFFGGSTSGSMYYYNYFKAIAKLHLQTNIIFISGHNSKLKNKCDKYVKKNHCRNITVLGYTKDVLNLMKISDLVISKPGGATVTECLEMKVPMLLVPGVGGQEKYNARFISKKKYGIKVRGVSSFKKMVRKIDNNPIILAKICNRLNSLDKNDSVEKINNLINKF